MFGVAVGGMGAGEQVRLLGAGGHAGGRPHPLHIDEHRRNFGEVGQAKQLGHQRDARARGGGEGAGPVPRGADDDADGRQFVLGLDDGHPHPAGIRLHPVFPGVVTEGLDDRGGRGDRVPADHGGAAVQGAERGGGVAVHDDGVAHPVALPYLEPAGVREVAAGVGVADLQGVDVGLGQPGVLFELAAQAVGEHRQFHVEERGQGADVEDVLEQRPHAHIGHRLVDQVGERDGNEGEVVPLEVLGQGPGGVVEEIAARLETVVVLAQGLAVDRHHQVVAAAPADVAGLVHPHLVPGGQPLDVRGEDVLRADRHAHAEHRLGEQVVGAGRTRAVDVGEPDDKIVDRCQLLHTCPACAEW